MRSGVEHGPINPIKNVAEGFYLVWKTFFFWFPVILEGSHVYKLLGIGHGTNCGVILGNILDAHFIKKIACCLASLVE